MGRGWRLKGEPLRCDSEGDCIEACRQRGFILTPPETLAAIADKLPRDCAALVEAGEVGAPR